LYEILAPKITKLYFGFGIFLDPKFCMKNALVIDEIDGRMDIFL